HCTLRNSIYFEPGGVSAHRFLVCSAALIQSATRDSPGALMVGPCISHLGRDDPGSRLGRGWGANGFPRDDRIWRPGDSLPGSSGIARATDSYLWRDPTCLAMYDCRESGYVECYYSIRALQCVYLCTGLELGDCHHLCPRIAGEQP